MDKKRLKRLFVMGLLTHPMVLFALAGGVGVLAAGLLLGWPGAVLWVGGGAALVGLGTLAYGLAAGHEGILRQALAETEQADRQEQAAAIGQLRARAAAGQELRACRALMDLKALTEAFEKPSARPRTISARTACGLSETISEIIRQCLESLKAALDLHEAAHKAGSDEVRGVLAGRRDRLIAAAEQSIVRLGETLGELQTLGGKDREEARLGELGRELAAQLEAARNVDRRMQSLGLEPFSDENGNLNSES